MTSFSPPRRVRYRRPLTALAALASASLFASEARAQQTTFHLDRLEVPGAPDDGIALFRPVTQSRTIFFAQVGLGYSLRPLHTSNITTERATLNGSAIGVIQDQLTQYTTAGVQLADRFTVAFTLPITWFQDGNFPNYARSSLSPSSETAFETGGPAVADTRGDFRAVLYRTLDRRFAVGAQMSVFFPTGNGSVTNFGGDGQTTAMFLVNAEYTWRFITIVGNTGVHLRPDASINDPVNDNGLGVGDEWRWAAGAFIPLKDSKGFERYRIGGTIMGQTGLRNSPITGNTIFTKRNTPVEWNGEFRMKFGPKDNWWWSAGAGTLIGNGYGAPDLRVVGLVGAYVPILESEATSPERKEAMRHRWRDERVGDADHDGIPDDIDACPTEPEDHQGNDPSDGCPVPPDRDGDGIPDQYDRCPDTPEDKDGIDDGDGCPEDDADQDGIPDVQDACPKEPGPKSPDPKRNGCPTTIQISGTDVLLMEPVHFATGSTVILPDSFKMLGEIANYLKVNPHIKRMSIEGHTDNRGDKGLNQRLSEGRAASVRQWLIEHGVESGRLESHGYGMDRPIDTNDTEAGRSKNRRVEFHIVQQDDPNKADKGNKGSTSPAESPPESTAPAPKPTGPAAKPAEPPKSGTKDLGDL